MRRGKIHSNSDVREAESTEKKYDKRWHRMYLEAVEGAFGTDVNFAQLIKLYNEPKAQGNEKKYSPGECCGTRKSKITGDPDPKHISTS